ncbi:hypothetical protein GCM10010502_44430 [Kitasatospora aureofaciens]|uniref:Uncharacterized protein n=2 Tax=Kitasatospora aureofaciens TaxID=1894 RepID=A0A8H9HSR7_KITAU|nr:hypothetical protein GCM10010502_44430 [Kitasatospora aureofaciens]
MNERVNGETAALANASGPYGRSLRPARAVVRCVVGDGRGTVSRCPPGRVTVAHRLGNGPRAERNGPVTEAVTEPVTHVGTHSVTPDTSGDMCPGLSTSARPSVLSGGGQTERKAAVMSILANLLPTLRSDRGDRGGRGYGGRGDDRGDFRGGRGDFDDFGDFDDEGRRGLRGSRRWNRC